MIKKDLLFAIKERYEKLLRVSITIVSLEERKSIPLKENLKSQHFTKENLEKPRKIKSLNQENPIENAEFYGVEEDFHNNEKAESTKVFIIEGLKEKFLLQIQGEQASLAKELIEGEFADLRGRAIEESFLRKVLFKSLSKQEIYLEASALGLEQERQYRLVLIESDNKAVLAPLFKHFQYLDLSSNEYIMLETQNDFLDRVDYEALGQKNTHIKFTFSQYFYDIKDIQLCFLEVSKLSSIHKVYYGSRQFLGPRDSGVETLISHLSDKSCKDFLNLSVNENSIQKILLDTELLNTLEKLFSNSLNITKAASELYAHRNTVLYRIEKIKTITGLDMNVFEDAVKMKLALLIYKRKEYIKNND